MVGRSGGVCNPTSDTRYARGMVGDRRDAIAGWREEKQSAWLYRVLAEREGDATRAQLFNSLAREADEQAGIWGAQAGAPMPAFRPALRARLVASLVRGIGVRPLRRVLAAMKVRGMSSFEPLHGPAGHVMPRSVEDVGLRHQGVTGGNLRAAVFGVNDGLVSNTALVMGVAGATGDAGFILLSGCAGLLAGALSMAAGEYVSVRSQRELYEHQIALERKELEAYPEEEAEELALIYAARGMALAEARAVARTLLADPDHALDVLAREELGLNPDELGSAYGAAGSSFVAFALGALVPLLPLLAGSTSLVGVAALASAALFGIGAALSLFTGRAALLGGVRMLAIGAGAGMLAYLLGGLVGGAIG
jgi:VIT1/CCC1 family predicted Fe2+/Mn2+ transporter